MTQTDTNPRDWSELKRLAEAAKRLDARGTMFPVDAVLELIAEVEQARRELAGERDAKERLRDALRQKDQAMEVLFRRLADNNIDTGDLIP